MQKQNIILAEISPGELLDKVTVLQIKKERIKDPAKLQNITRELEILQKTCDEYVPKTDQMRKLTASLKEMNEIIWDQSDAIRILDMKKEYGEKFVQISLDIHHSNDKRAAIKKEINLLLESNIIEEKSYDELHST
ncbi:DUF6165 family protein [bacterium]|nr:DUF6165 family protein [bacterium]